MKIENCTMSISANSYCLVGEVRAATQWQCKSLNDLKISRIKKTFKIKQIKKKQNQKPHELDNFNFRISNSGVLNVCS